MPRGAYTTKFKPPKSSRVDVPAVPSMDTKPTRPNKDWRTGILTPTFLSRNLSEAKLAGPSSNEPLPVRESSSLQEVIADAQAIEADLPVDVTQDCMDLGCDENPDETSSALRNEVELAVRPISSRTSSAESFGGEETYEADLDTFEDLAIEETQSSASSLYSRDSASIYSSTSSLYSSGASSLYSSGASTYSFDESESKDTDRSTRTGFAEQSIKDAGGMQYQQRARAAAVRRQEPQDAASRERSSLARKASLFKNSRLSPHLPSFSTSLPTWSMVCRAAHASEDCYDSHALTRRGIYTPADTSNDIKAMIIDDQSIDDSRLVIVSIRGTKCQSLSDWAVNKAANPAKPVGFLDDEENACHAGFLQVAKAMVGQVATQLQQHPASLNRPSLLFTGHSAGGAVAAMLYSHMLSTSVSSGLTALASQFSSINCVTFGAPPISLTPLPIREHSSGIFLSFANEGDPVLRLSNAAYMKSLWKLMTASLPASAPAVKVIRRSRGSAVIRKTLPAAPTTPWEELPLWPTPAPPLTNAGEVILLRDNENGGAVASSVTPEELREVIFGDFAQHTVEMYIRRVKQVALNAMTGHN